MSEMHKLTTLKEFEGTPTSTKQLTSHLIDVNSKFIETLKSTFNKANFDNEQGIANFLAERIDQHQKWNWFLKSSV